MAIGKIDKNKIIRAGQGTFAQYNALSAEDKLNKIWFDSEKKQIYLNDIKYAEVSDVTTNILISDDTKNLLSLDTVSLTGNIQYAISVSSTEIYFSTESGLYSLNINDNTFTQIYDLTSLHQNVNHMAYDSVNNIFYCCLSGSKIIEIKPNTQVEIKLWDTPNNVELCLIEEDSHPWFIGEGLMTFDNIDGKITVKQLLSGNLQTFVTGTIVDNLICLGSIIDGIHIYDIQAKTLSLINSDAQVLSSFKDKNNNVYFLGAGVYVVNPKVISSFQKLSADDYMCGCCDIDNNIYICSANNIGIKKIVWTDNNSKPSITSTNIVTGSFNDCDINENGNVVYFLGSGQGILKRLKNETEIKPTNIITGSINTICNNQLSYFFGNDSKIYYTNNTVIPYGKINGSWVPMNTLYYDKSTIDDKFNELKKLINP